jgi:hypothetical protein
MEQDVVPVPGMTISIRSRRDVVIVDPERFLAAARQALHELDPDLNAEETAAAITDVYDAVHALLDTEVASSRPMSSTLRPSKSATGRRGPEYASLTGPMGYRRPAGSST